MALTDEDKIRERIKYQTELLKMIWISLIATAGGTIGLLLGEFSPGRWVTAAAGIVLVAILWYAVDQINQRIERLLR